MRELIARPAQRDDIAAFMADVRPCDRAECINASGIPLGVGLKHAIEQGREVELIALPDGSPLVLWGVGVVVGMPFVGAIWLVATVTAERHIRRLHRLLVPRLITALDRHPILWNVVWERNELHVKWLKRVGAEFIAHHPNYGPLGEPFLEFTITKDTINSTSRGRPDV